MKSRSERSSAEGQKKMEGVNMPASFKFAWRWLVGATVATIVCLVALPSVGHATTITICIKNVNGKIKGISADENSNPITCAGNETPLVWQSTGPAGPTGPKGVQGDPGDQGAQGLQGPTGGPGPAGGQGAPGPQGAAGLAGYPGPTGPSGAMGDAGPQGPQGDIGPTGPTGPAGFMGADGIRGPTGDMGVTGDQGPSGTNGAPEPNISVFTGGSLGTLGALEGIDLSGRNSVGFPGAILILGPGNGADSGAPPPSANSLNPEDVEVPMTIAGTAERLFVNVDNDPGTQQNNGIPSTFWFFLCNGNSFPSNCGLACSILGPDTTCSDLSILDFQTFAVGDNMSLWAYADYFGANDANVKWSVTYDHGAALIIP